MQKGDAMKYTLGLTLALFFFMVSSAFAALSELIEQNVKDSSKSYDKLIGAEQEKATQRLWVHVQSKKQEKAVLEAVGWLKSIELAGKKIDLRPIQSVKSGPSDNQLRFFKRQDKNNAEKLLIKLGTAIPQLHLIDLSQQYDGISWIKTGHYELWLAPGLEQLNVPR
jgi:hypothetical protein